MKNPFVSPDIQDIVKDRQLSLRHVVYLLVGGCVVVGVLIALGASGYLDRYVSAPHKPTEIITETGLQAESVTPPPRWSSLEERLAESASEAPTTTPTQEELQIRAEEVEAAQAETGDTESEGPTRSIEERLREIEEQSREI